MSAHRRGPGNPGSVLQNALVTPRQRRADRSFGLRGNSWTPEPLALAARSRQAGLDALDDHRALELGEHAHHLEHRLAGRGAGVEALLMQVQIDALGMQLGEEPDKLLQRPAEAIDRPCRHLVELTPRQRRSYPGRLSRPLVPLIPASVNVATTSQPCRAATASSSLDERVAPDDVVTDEAATLLATKLKTPLQIGQHLVRAFEAGFEVGAKPVDVGVVEAVLSRQLDDLEPRLIRNGYDVRSLVEQFDAKPAEIRQLLRGDLDPARSQELMDEMRAAGLPT
jgi:hypothetical protein